MNNNLMPEQRPDVNGKITTRWIKSRVQSSAQRFLAPAPTTGTPPEKTERSRSLYEKLVDSIVNLLLGPEEKSSAADEEMRNLLREKLSQLPERTVKNLGEAWEKAQEWADKGLDSTQFGDFSQRVRTQVNDLLAAQDLKDQTPEQTAERIDDYADRVRRTAESRSANHIPPMPDYAPSAHLNVVHDQDPEYSPLNDFFEEVDHGRDLSYNSSINDLMDNGRTRRHH